MERAKGERFSDRILQRMQNVDACTPPRLFRGVLVIRLITYVLERKNDL
jgi:hypothetical protein